MPHSTTFSIQKASAVRRTAPILCILRTLSSINTSGIFAIRRYSSTDTRRISSVFSFLFIAVRFTDYKINLFFRKTALFFTNSISTTVTVSNIFRMPLCYHRLKTSYLARYQKPILITPHHTVQTHPQSPKA